MSAYRLEIRAGEVLFRQGDTATTAFLVESGEIQISTGADAQRKVLGVLRHGDLLGEMAVIDESARTATAAALTDAVLTPIDRAQFTERLDSADPVVRALLLSQLARYRSLLAQMAGDALPPMRMGERVPTRETVALDKIRLESQLREALERRELEIRLQPILDIGSGRVAGFEALTRWTHPERGPVSPADFIALAEETSLIVPVGDYVLGEVCAALRAFAAGDASSLFVAINVSGRQLRDPGFIDRVLHQLVTHGVAANRLKIEITESLVLDYGDVAAFIGRCHAAGIRVALDDFGTGYSSLGHLHKLRFDTLKLDQGFVRQLDDSRCLAIVRAVVGMAEALGCDIVAEGVETDAQLQQLRALSCQYAQGWLVGRPLAIEAALRLT